MVSTRRMAQSGPGKEANAGLSLHKRPLRKATTKQTAAAPKSRGIRNPQADTDHEGDASKSTERRAKPVVRAEVSLSKPPANKVVAKGRSLKVEGARTGLESHITTRAIRSRAQPTKAQKPTVKTTAKPAEKPVVNRTGNPTGELVEKPTEKPTEEPVEKLIRRPTEKPVEIRTRRVAPAVPVVHPLSPKKITQVTKPRARINVPVDAKRPISKRPAPVVSTLRNGGRPRESSENSDVVAASKHRSTRASVVTKRPVASRGTVPPSIRSRAVASKAVQNEEPRENISSATSPSGSPPRVAHMEEDQRLVVASRKADLQSSTSAPAARESRELELDAGIDELSSNEESHTSVAVISSRHRRESKDLCSPLAVQYTGVVTLPQTATTESLSDTEDPDETILVDMEEDNHELSEDCQPIVGVDENENNDEGTYEVSQAQGPIRHFEAMDIICAPSSPSVILSSSIKPQPETLVWESLSLEAPISSTPRLSFEDAQLRIPSSAVRSDGRLLLDSLHTSLSASLSPELAEASVNLTDFINFNSPSGSFQSPNPPLAAHGTADQATPDAIGAAVSRELPHSIRGHRSPLPECPFPRSMTRGRRISMPSLRYLTPNACRERPRTADYAKSASRGKRQWREWRGAPGLLSANAAASRPPSSGKGMQSAEVDSAASGPSPVRTRRIKIHQDIPLRATPGANAQDNAVPTLPDQASNIACKSPDKGPGSIPKSNVQANLLRQYHSPATPISIPSFAQISDHARHAATVCAPRRFLTPLKFTPLRARSHKTRKVQKVAFQAATPPRRVPVKFDCATPVEAPLTPHPSRPLTGVMALVEIYTSEGASASTPFTALLHRLGARTTRSWTDQITHVIFKDGSPKTLQRVRSHNKDADEVGGIRIACVNGRWVSDCDTQGAHVDESFYAVDVDELPRGGKRRRQSMEPTVLHNFGGSVVRDRKSSSSLSRTPRALRPSSPNAHAEVRCTTPEPDTHRAMGVMAADENSPGTPAWLHPENLVQQTAPLKRVRKLEFERPNKRRLTCWPGDTVDED